MTIKKELYQNEYKKINNHNLVRNLKLRYENLEVDCKKDVNALQRMEKQLFYSDQKVQKKINKIYLEEETNYGYDKLSLPE